MSLKKIKKFISYMIHEIYAEPIVSFENLKKIDNNIYYVRLIPGEYNVEKIPIFKQYCEKFGLNLINTFKQDFSRKHGYRDYHECYMFTNERFNKKFTEEDFK